MDKSPPSLKQRAENKERDVTDANCMLVLPLPRFVLFFVFNTLMYEFICIMVHPIQKAVGLSRGISLSK